MAVEYTLIPPLVPDLEYTEDTLDAVTATGSPEFLITAETEFGVEAVQGEAWSLVLPEIVHPEGKEIARIEANLNDAHSFIKFDDQVGLLEIEEKQTLEYHVGFYQLSFVAIDEDGNESEPFVLMLHIVPNNSS